MDVNDNPAEGGSEIPLLSNDSAPATKLEVDAVYRKVAWTLVPFCFATFFVCYVDRTNISLAAMDMSSDIGLTKSQFGMASSLFFITYMIFQIPSNEILKRVGAPLWLGILLIGWGLASSLTAFVRNVTDLYVLRLLLGIFEAGTIPGVFFYLGQFFPASRSSGVYGISLAGCAVGMAISAPLAAGFLSMDGVLDFRGWQWLFLLEGLPAIILGVGVMFYLPKSPESAPFLTKRERVILESDRTPSKAPVDGNLNGLLYLLRTVVMNIKLGVIVFCGLLFGTMRYVAMFWTPLWIDALVSGGGLDWEKAEATSHSSNSVQVALLSTLPYALAAFSTGLFGWTSEKLQDRTIHCFFLLLIGGLFFSLLPYLAGVDVALGFVALVCGHIGVNGIWGPYVSLQVSFMTEENKAFALAWMSTIGNFSGLFGPMITGFLADQTGSYKSGIWGTGAMTIVAGLAIIFVKDAVRENRGKGQVQLNLCRGGVRDHPHVSITFFNFLQSFLKLLIIFVLLPLCFYVNG
ncbi:hypothetical protein BSKO_03071 [Bryopsis sp. KO-2023]|nr:hypothetical protein BSKO_03071 [Bryopsis sp. KO-2023]